MISGGLLDLEVNSILKTTNPDTNNVVYELIVHTPENDIYVNYVNSVEVMRDYNGNIGDYIYANIIIGLGDYIKVIQPYRDNLEMTIKITRYASISSTRYKAIILNNSGATYAKGYTSMSQTDLNKLEPMNIEIQCLHKELEALRAVSVDGIYRNTTVENLIIGLINKYTKTIQIEGTTVNISVNIIKPNNDYNYVHINIPTGTRLLDVPSYLQNTNYGVYNGNIGTYLQKYDDRLILFVYPLYDKNVFETVTKKLNIYNIASKKLTFIENTYKLDGDILKILTGLNVRSLDTAENELSDTGNAITAANPDLILQRNVIVTDNNVTTYPTNNLTAQAIKNKRDGMNLNLHLGVETNLYKYRSDIVKKSMGIYQIPWNYPNIDLIYPGMPCSFLYEDNVNGIVKLTGTVQSVYSRYTKTNNTTVALLNIAVIKPTMYLDL
jgi:hypothetical protein